MIKVEPPAGDETRTWGPPYVDGERIYYLGMDRNERSLALDLVSDAGRDIACRLAASSGRAGRRLCAGTWTFRPRLPTTGQLNPRLIYVSISGFGRTDLR